MRKRDRVRIGRLYKHLFVQSTYGYQGHLEYGWETGMGYMALLMCLSFLVFLLYLERFSKIHVFDL